MSSDDLRHSQQESRGGIALLEERTHLEDAGAARAAVVGARRPMALALVTLSPLVPREH